MGCFSQGVYMSQRMTKPTKWHVRPAEISQGIHPVWSAYLLCTLWVAKDPSFLHADSKETDQTGWMLRLIWVYAWCLCHFVGFAMRRLIVLYFSFTGNFAAYDFDIIWTIACCTVGGLCYNSSTDLLMFNMLGKKVSRQKFEIFFLFFSRKYFDISCTLSPEETMCMKCQSLFSGENKKKYQFVVCWIYPEGSKG